MAASGLTRAVVRRAGRVLPDAVVRRAARARAHGASLSVVVVVTDDNATFLEECVAALLAQSRPPEEVVLVVAGAARETGAAVVRVAGTSWRITSQELPGAAWAASIRAGADSATGDLLAFVDAGEVMEPGTLEELVAALVDDPAAGLAGGGRGDLGRLRLGDLLVRRSAWQPDLDVPEGPYAEWWVAAQLVLSAGRVAPVSYRRRVGDRRGTGVAFGTMPVRAPWVADWWRAVDAVAGALSGPDRESFWHWAMSVDAVDYLDDAERCSMPEWGALSAAARTLLGSAPAEVVADVAVEARVRLWLAAEDRRADLERFCADRWLDEGHFPTTVDHGRVLADLPVEGDPLPAEVLTLGPAETPLRTQLRAMRWAGAGVLELEVLAFIAHVGWDTGPAEHRVRLTGPGGGVHTLVARTAASHEVNVLSGARFADHSAGVLLARVAVDEVLADARPGDRWQVEVESTVAGLTRSGALDDVDLRGSAAALPVSLQHGWTLRPRRSAGDGDGGWSLVVTSPQEAARSGPSGWQVEEVLLDGDRLLVRGRAGDSSGRLDLRGPHHSAPVEARVVGERFEATLLLRHDPWQLGERPLPPGTYRFHVSSPGGGPLRVAIAPSLAAAAPSWQRSDTFRLRLQRGLDGAVLVTLAPPLAEGEIGPLAQQRLQRWYATDEHRVDPSVVYLQSYTGQVATDSPLAIHHELRRTRPELRLLWAVADRSTVVPPGGEPVLLRSRDWYDALASSGYLVTNIDMERWFRKRPGQQLLQSFHGYPAKTMGIAAWQAKSFTPLRIERQLRRTSGTWDLLLTPAPAMDEHYRREYRYDGPILAAGYPRDDVLVGPEAEEIRRATRRRLGIADGRRAVLYAPTWRDDLATNFRAAAMSTAFDVQAAAAELGEDYVILLRGHRFHRNRDAAGARLLDVTDYPEINDLVLAADAAVLDYSSLRFDFALTGRPMVFLVPDLHRYTGGVRGFLFDFAGSAPGPHLDTTAEVVSALRDLDGLAAAYRAEMARFGEQYNAWQDGHAAERVVREFFGDRPQDGS